MNRMQSLVKKHGGWNKLKTAGQLNMISAVLAFIENNKSPDILDKAIDALKMAFNISDNDNKRVCDNISAEMHNKIDDAYEYACNNKKLYSYIWLLPRCVVESAVANSIFIFISDNYMLEPARLKKRLDRFLNSKNNKSLASAIDELLSYVLSMCLFSSCPEKSWWGDFYKNDDAYHKCKELKFYKDYIKAHPECEEEIKEFCKQ